jgi:hypothetical protein
LGLFAGAALLGGVIVGGTTLVGKRKADPLPEYTNTCSDLCWLRKQEAEADAELEAAKAQLGQVEAAWHRARDYLANQLRADYVDSKRNRVYGSWAAMALGGPVTWFWALGIPINVAVFGRDSAWLTDSARWNSEVNRELISAQAEIDRIHDDNAWKSENRLAAATERAAQAENARSLAEQKLVALRGDYPDVNFPPCGCE